MSTGFIRVINRPQVLALAFGAMVGWSWIALTGVWIRDAGPVGAMLAFLVGTVALLYLPWSPAALAWPQEWGIVIAWCALGFALYLGRGAAA